MALVFVYGSLLSGMHNHPAFLGKAKKVSNDAFIKDCTMYDFGAFPAVKAHGNGVVSGEVYDVSAEQLARLDWLEGHPLFYRRSAVECYLPEPIKAITYFIVENPHGEYKEIKSGDWRGHCARKG